MIIRLHLPIISGYVYRNTYLENANIKLYGKQDAKTRQRPRKLRNKMVVYEAGGDTTKQINISRCKWSSPEPITRNITALKIEILER